MPGSEVGVRRPGLPRSTAWSLKTRPCLRVALCLHGLGRHRPRHPRPMGPSGGLGAAEALGDLPGGPSTVLAPRTALPLLVPLGA